MPLPRLLLAFALGSLALTTQLHAEEETSRVLKGSSSPDGRFAARLDEVKDPDGSSSFEVALIDRKSGSVICRLGEVGRPWLESARVVWAPDSRRVAYVHRSRRGDWTDLFARKGESFEDVTMPTLPSGPEIGRANAKTVEASYTAVRWTKPNVLLLDNKCEDEDGNGATGHFALTFDTENNVKVTRLAGGKRSGRK